MAPIGGSGRARTGLTFWESYHAYNPVLRALFERRVHCFISAANTATFDKALRRLGPVERVA